MLTLASGAGTGVSAVFLGGCAAWLKYGFAKLGGQVDLFFVISNFGKTPVGVSGSAPSLTNSPQIAHLKMHYFFSKRLVL